MKLSHSILPSTDYGRFFFRQRNFHSCYVSVHVVLPRRVRASIKSSKFQFARSNLNRLQLPPHTWLLWLKTQFFSEVLFLWLAQCTSLGLYTKVIEPSFLCNILRRNVQKEKTENWARFWTGNVASQSSWPFISALQEVTATCVLPRRRLSTTRHVFRLSFGAMMLGVFADTRKIVYL